MERETQNAIFTGGVLTAIALGVSAVILALREVFPDNGLIYALAPLLTYFGARALVLFEKRKR